MGKLDIVTGVHNNSSIDACAPHLPAPEAQADGGQALGALLHVISPGIHRYTVFLDNADYKDFLYRLVRTGNVPVSRVMKRLLTSQLYSLFHD